MCIRDRQKMSPLGNFHDTILELRQLCAKYGEWIDEMCIRDRNWFYERARGQYADMLSRETTTRRKKDYKGEHPLFTKTDLAKCEMCIRDST